MDRHWLMTWTCYGTWLPGDARGFVGNIREADASHVSHNIPGTPVDADMPGLKAYVLQHMRGEPVSLDKEDAETLIVQYQETARIRGWVLHAASVMFNHTHVLLGVPGDPEPQSILETLKSWATRALKKRCEIPANGTFWTSKGSKRKLANDEAIAAGVIYVVRKQPDPLVVWYAPIWQELVDSYDLASRAP
ncbi:MAG: transposase [Planctomycetes bacterium]|nr:transposase [Planctomycetota bacterium]